MFILSLKIEKNRQFFWKKILLFCETTLNVFLYLKWNRYHVCILHILFYWWIINIILRKCQISVILNKWSQRRIRVYRIYQKCQTIIFISSYSCFIIIFFLEKLFYKIDFDAILILRKDNYYPCTNCLSMFKIEIISFF